MLASVEAEIAKLQRIADALRDSDHTPRKRRTGKKGTMSAAARAKISAAQKARWAKVKKG